MPSNNSVLILVSPASVYLYAAYAISLEYCFPKFPFESTNGVLSAEGFISPTINVNSLSSNTITTDWQLITITTETAINASDVDIGRLEGSSFFTGSLDRPQIWNRALSADEVKLLYESYNPCLKLYGGDKEIKENGFIRVDKNINNSIYFDNPESNLYGKTYFYVMQYQARNNGGVPKSTGSNLPWVNINQINAKAVSEAAGYHLITNWEWMAIARDIEQVPENWTGGAVGSGMIKRGNVGITDAGSYNGADPETGILNDKAKLKLSNGEEIYHFSGNVWEWLDRVIPTQEGIVGKSGAWNEINGSTGDFINWTTSTNPYLLYTEVGPVNQNLTSTHGIGKIAKYDHTDDRAFLRGGRWTNGANAGVFALYLDYSPSYSSTNIGFRCARYGNE